MQEVELLGEQKIEHLNSFITLSWKHGGHNEMNDFMNDVLRSSFCAYRNIAPRGHKLVMRVVTGLIHLNPFLAEGAAAA
jgi:hypothetical protein